MKTPETSVYLTNCNKSNKLGKHYASITNLLIPSVNASSKSLRLVKSSRSPSHLLFTDTQAELINQLIN